MDLKFKFKNLKLNFVTILLLIRTLLFNRHSNMINITNKTEAELNSLIQKYYPVLQTLKQYQLFPQQAVIIDVAKSFINERHAGLNPHWKSLLVLLVMKMFNSINNETDVYELIEDFLQYKKNEYQDYVNDIVMCVDELERDYVFMKMFINHINIKPQLPFTI